MWKILEKFVSVKRHLIELKYIRNTLKAWCFGISIFFFGFVCTKFRIWDVMALFRDSIGSDSDKASFAGRSILSAVLTVPVTVPTHIQKPQQTGRYLCGNFGQMWKFWKNVDIFGGHFWQKKETLFIVLGLLSSFITF